MSPDLQSSALSRWTPRVARWTTTARPGRGERLALALALGLARGLAATLPAPSRRQALRELVRTIDAFRCFRQARLPAATDGALAAEIARLRGVDLFRALWATEGLGHQRASGLPASPGLLGDAVTRDLPVGSLVPLHAGLGLAMCRDRLSGIAAATQVAPALCTLVEDLETSSSTGCRELAIDAIGLYVRTLLPQWVADFDRAFRDGFPDHRNLFWHGVGRALYFLFPRARSGRADWGGWQRARLETTDRQSRRATRTGFIWALSLVNIREPGVIASFLRARGGTLDEDAFTNALIGSVLAWYAWAGSDDAIDRLLAHAPEDEEIRWQERVVARVRTAIEERSASLAGSRRLGALYMGAWR